MYHKQNSSYSLLQIGESARMYRNPFRFRRGGVGGDPRKQQQQLPKHQQQSQRRLQQQERGILSTLMTMDRKRTCPGSKVVVLVMMRWMDVMFLLVVAIGVWRMATRSHAPPNHNNPHLLSLHDMTIGSSSLIVQDGNENNILSNGSLRFRGTRACAQSSKPKQTDGGTLSTTSETMTCQAHFPLDIIQAVDSSSSVDKGYCLRTMLLGCQRTGSAVTTNTSTTTCNFHKRNHAALLNPLLFDGAEHPGGNIGQMIVLSDGINEMGNMVAEDVVKHLPGLVLDPFRRYAKAYSKIKSKILPHAFEAMDRKLYEEHQSLWNKASASALIILQYTSTVFLASAGNSIGFLARWNPQSGQAEILQSATPDLESERKRIQESGGMVQQADATSSQSKSNGQLMVYVKDDPAAGGIAASRAIGAGRFKLKAGVTASPVVQELNLSQLQQQSQTSRRDANNPMEPTDHFFVVAASSPVLKVWNEQELADRIGTALFSSDTRLNDQVNKILRQVSEHLLNRMEPQKSEFVYPDQLTLVASKIL